MADDNDKDKVKDSNPKPNPFTQFLKSAVGQAENIGKLGVVGLLATMFLREEQGREMIKNLAGLTGHSLERIGIEGGPIALDVQGWLIQTYENFRKAILRAVSLIVLAAALSLLTAAYVEWAWVRGLVGTAGIVLVMYVTHDLWVRWIPAIIGIGAAIGVIDKLEAKSALDVLRNPFSVVFGGLRGVPASISWVLNFWKWIALINIWYTVGVLYITLVPLHQTPGLIPMALPVIPLFFMIPLAEPWFQRGAQYTWILWAGVFYLINIALLAIFPAEIYQPILDGDIWARVIMVVVIAIEAMFAIRLAGDASRSIAVTPAGRILGSQVATYYPGRSMRFPALVGWVAMVAVAMLTAIYLVSTFAPWIWTINTAIGTH